MKKIICVSLLLIQLSFNVFGENSNVIEIEETEYIAVGGVGDFYLGETFTISAWIYPIDGGAVFSKRSSLNSDGAPGIDVIANADSKLRLFIRSADGDGVDGEVFESQTIINAEEWTHFCVVRNGDDWKIYINGVIDASTSILMDDISSDEQPLIIGAILHDGQPYNFDHQMRIGNPYTGYLDELCIWEYALEAAEVSDILETKMNVLIEENDPVIDGLISYISANPWCSQSVLSTAPQIIDGIDGDLQMSLGFGYTSDDAFMISNSTNPPLKYALESVECEHPDFQYSGNSCLQFDGEDDYLELECNNLALSNAKTIAFWFKPEVMPDKNGCEVLLEHRISETISSYSFRLSARYTGGISYISTVGGYYFNASNDNPVVVGEWNHIAIVYDGPDQYMYLNGALANFRSNIGTIEPLTLGKIIVGNNAVPNMPFQGCIDELVYYDCAVSGAFIRDRMYYKQPNPQYNKNLVVYYDFDEAGGFTDVRSSAYGAFSSVVSGHCMSLSSDAPISNHIHRRYKQQTLIPNGNYISNWSFEDESRGKDGWRLYNGETANIWAIREQDAVFGKNVSRITDGLGFDSGIEYTISENSVEHDNGLIFEALRGKNVRVSAYVKYEPSNPNQSTIIYLGYDKNTVGDASDNVEQLFSCTDGTWRRISLDAQISDTDPAFRFYIKFNQTIQNDSLDIDGVILEIAEGTEPSEIKSMTSYIDYMGRPYQIQKVGMETKSISGARYGKNGQKELSGLALNGGSFINTFNDNYWTQLQNSYDANGPDPDAGGYPFTTYEYYDDPLGRIKSIKPPGLKYQDKGVKYEYGNNTADDMVIADNDPEQVGEYYQVKQYSSSRSAYDVVNVSWKDKFGRARGECLDYTGAKLLEISVYNAAGNVIYVKTPKYLATGCVYPNLVPRYSYNSIGQLIARELPDMNDKAYNLPSEAEYDVFKNPDITSKYRLDGKLVFTQDAKQKVASKSGAIYFSMYTYDYLDRITRMKTCRWDAHTWNDLDPDIHSVFSDSTVMNMSVWDAEPDWSCEPWCVLFQYQGKLENLKGKTVAEAYYDETSESFGITCCSYDIHGRITKLIQKVPGLQSSKEILYVYDAAGDLKSMTYDNAFTVHYSYDTNGKLSKVGETDGGNEYCTYAYNTNGSLQDFKLYGSNGTAVVQEVEYSYGLHGQLTAINDCDATSATKAFAQKFNYCDDDSYGIQDYFNGNIASITSAYGISPNGFLDGKDRCDYHYNNLNMLTSAQAGLLGQQTAFHNRVGSTYGITYGPNGALEALTNKRFEINEDGGTYIEDEVDHVYNVDDNKLFNAEGSMTDQKYDYDANGNMVINEDREMGSIASGQEGIEYNVNNMPIRMLVGSSTLQFVYDAAGNRVSKKIITQE